MQSKLILLINTANVNDPHGRSFSATWVAARKAWKNCEDQIHSFQTALHTHELHARNIDLYPSPMGFFIDPHNDQLPVGLIAQLIEHCIGIAAEVRPFSPLLSSAKKNCKDRTHLFQSAVYNINFIYYTENTCSNSKWWKRVELMVHMTEQINKPSSQHRGGKPTPVGHSLREHRHQHRSSRFYQLFQYTTKKITDEQTNKQNRDCAYSDIKERHDDDKSVRVTLCGLYTTYEVGISMCRSIGRPSSAWYRQVNAEVYSESGLI